MTRWPTATSGSPPRPSPATPPASPGSSPSTARSRPRWRRATARPRPGWWATTSRARTRSPVARVSVITGLDHVQVAAPPGCEAEARGFYGALLGLSELDKPPALAGRGGAWFGCGAQQLHVGVAGDFVPATKAHPALGVSDA